MLEQAYNDDAAKAQAESGFNSAFAKNKYTAYSMEGNYLNDSNAFIESLNGKSRYLGTIKYKNVEFGIRAYDQYGVIYCNTTPDASYPYKIAVTTEDHQVNYVMLRQNDAFISNMRYFFERGCFRFKDLRCKEAVLKLLSY